MQRLRPLTAAALFCGMTAAPCHALDNVNVWIAGGLLGQMRGFCEVQDNSAIEERTSCPPGRVPYGGLLALSEVMGQAGWAGAYALLAGNNFPKDFAIPGGNDERHADFWTALRGAHAQVIALGQDDLLRAMLPARYDQQPPADSVERNVGFFQQGVKDYGFLASNAFMRTKRKGINSVQSHGYTLQVEPDETVAWTTKELSVLLPIHARKGGTYRLRIGGKEVAPSSVKEPVVTFPVMLDADTVYEIVITAEWSGKDAESATFRLKVDRPLTKWDNPGAGKLEGAPVALLSGRGARLLVVSLIDPGILTSLDSTRWTYKSGGGTEELKLLPPDKVAGAILSRADTSAAGSTAVPVLLSDLGDALNLKVLRQSDRWRITALNPDTAMMGCHSGKTGCSQGRTRPYSFGSVAVLDEGSARAQVWARPEWDGESTVQISADAAADGTWGRVQAHSKPVSGYVRGRLQPNITQGPTVQTYVSARLAVREVVVPAQKRAARLWWKTREDVAIVMMEAMRRMTGSEMALADLKMIDDDVVDELRAEAEAQGGDYWVSYPQLMDVFWRHDAYVRVFVKGSDLADLLVKVGQLPADDDGGYCVRGARTGGDDMGCAIPQKIDAAALRVNGRFVDPNMIYSLAAPQGLAERLSLGDHKKAPTDVLTGLSQFLEADGIPKLRKETAWRNPDEHRWLGMFYIPPASVEVGGQNYHVPSQGNGTPDTSGFAAIPNVNEKVTHTFKLNMTGELHLVPVSLPWITLDISSKVNLNRLDTYPATADGVKQIAYSPDVWTNGAALRSRWISDQFNDKLLARVRFPAVRVDPFVGYFDDSSIYHFDNVYLTSARDPITNKPLFMLEEQDRKPNYLYLAAGFTLGDIRLGPYVKFKGTSFEHDAGLNYTAPKGLSIGATSYDMNQVRRCGIQNLIDGATGCAAAALDAQSNIRYVYAAQRQSRNQLATSLEFAKGEGASKRSFTLDFKGNRWSASRDGYTPLDPLWTAEITLKSGVPIGKGISIGPYFRYLLVKAYGSPGVFESRRYGFMVTLPALAKAGSSTFVY